MSTKFKIIHIWYRFFNFEDDLQVYEDWLVLNSTTIEFIVKELKKDLRIPDDWILNSDYDLEWGCTVHTLSKQNDPCSTNSPYILFTIDNTS